MKHSVFFLWKEGAKDIIGNDDNKGGDGMEQAASGSAVSSNGKSKIVFETQTRITGWDEHTLCKMFKTSQMIKKVE